MKLNPRNTWDMIMQTYLDGEGALNWRIVARRHVGLYKRDYLVEVESWAQSSPFAEAPAATWHFIIWSDGTMRSCVTLTLGIVEQRTYYGMA
jgi:hypothetical protein